MSRLAASIGERLFSSVTLDEVRIDRKTGEPRRVFELGATVTGGRMGLGYAIAGLADGMEKGGPESSPSPRPESASPPGGLSGDS